MLRKLLLKFGIIIRKKIVIIIMYFLSLLHNLLYAGEYLIQFCYYFLHVNVCINVFWYAQEQMRGCLTLHSIADSLST